MSDTRERILQTAFSLFLRKSYKEVTLNELIEATGLSKGAFYHYFASKEQLFIEVINVFFFEKSFIDYSKLSHDSLWSFYHDYAKAVQKLINSYKDYIDYKKTEASINYFTLIFDALKHFPGFRKKLMEAQKKELNAWTKIVKIGREKGEYSSSMSDEQLARMFIYSNDGIALYVLMNGNYNNIEHEMITLWDNFYKEVKD